MGPRGVCGGGQQCHLLWCVHVLFQVWKRMVGQPTRSCVRLCRECKVVELKAPKSIFPPSSFLRSYTKSLYGQVTAVLVIIETRFWNIMLTYSLPATESNSDMKISLALCLQDQTSRAVLPQKIASSV